MTDRPPTLRALATVALGAFAALFAVLAWQMREGRDPALAAMPARHPRRIVVRRIERRVIVTRVVPAREPLPAGGDTVSASTSVASTGMGAAPAPVTRTS